MRWRLEPVENYSAYAAAWRALNAGNNDSPVLDPDFVAPLLDQFGTPRARLAICGDPAAPTAMTIISPVRIGVWQTFQPSQAPIGLWVSRPEALTEDLAISLLRHLPRHTLLLGLSQMDPDICARPASDARIRTLDYIPTARITVAENFDRYWAARGKNLRHNLRRQTNKMAAAGVTGVLECHRQPDNIAGSVAEYGRLETAGWKSAGGTAVAPDNVQGRFYRDMLQRFAMRGASRVYIYRLDGAVAAVDLCIEQGGTLVILKTTHDESITGYSPALLMRRAAFQEIFSRGAVRQIEFYGRLMDWHTKWTQEVRILHHINCYRFPVIARLLDRKSESARVADAPEPRTT